MSRKRGIARCAQAFAGLLMAGLVLPPAAAQDTTPKPSVLREGRYVDFSEFPAGTALTNEYYVLGLELAGGMVAADGPEQWLQALPGAAEISLSLPGFDGDESASRLSLGLIGPAGSTFGVTAYGSNGAVLGTKPSVRAGQRAGFSVPGIASVTVQPNGAPAFWGIDELLVNASEAVLTAESQFPVSLEFCAQDDAVPHPDFVLTVDAAPLGTIARQTGVDSCASVPLPSADTPALVQEFGFIDLNSVSPEGCFRLAGLPAADFSLHMLAAIIHTPYFITLEVSTAATGCHEIPGSAYAITAYGSLP